MKKNYTDEEIDEMLKKASSEAFAPESLSSENIIKMINKKKAKRNRFIAGISTGCVAAAAVIAIAATSILSPLSPKAPELTTLMVNETAGVSLSIAESPDEIFKLLEKNNERYKGNGFNGSSTLMTGSIESAAAEDAAVNMDSASGSDFTKTNNQVDGVDELDTYKTDGGYIYIVRGNEIAILKAGDTPERVATINANIIGEDYPIIAYDAEESKIASEEFFSSEYFEGIFLSENKLFVIASCYSNDGESTITYAYDVTTPENPVMLAKHTQDGYYVGSRLTEGYIYTYTNKCFWNEIYKDQPETYMPKADGCVIECGNIFIPDPELIADNTYTYFTALAVNDPSEFTDQKAVLMSGYNSYVTSENIYIMGTVWESIESDTSKATSDVADDALTDIAFFFDGKPSTELWKLGIKDGKITALASGKIEGEATDQFCYHEKDGHFCVLTTTSVYSSEGSDRWNTFYILDDNLNVIKTIDDIAHGETIYSARYLGDYCYFVTFLQTDPLFTIDLSDVTNPVIVGELKLPGFSDYLHPYGDNMLLGIGYEADSEGKQTGVKLSMYDISNPSDIKELSSKTIYKFDDNSSAYIESLWNYHGITVDFYRNAICFSMQEYNWDESIPENDRQTSEFVVYSFDKTSGFTKQTGIDFKALHESDYIYSESSFASIRGMFINDRLFALNNCGDIAVMDTMNYSTLGQYLY